MISILLITIFSIFGLLFFITTLFTKTRYMIIIFNVLFLFISYIAIAEILGEPKPVGQYPLYQHSQWDASDVYVVGGYWDDKRIYLLVKEDNKIKTYSWSMNLAFLDELKKAQEAMEKENGHGGNRWGFKLGNHKKLNHYDGLNDDSDPTVILPDPQKNQPLPKNPQINGGVMHDLGNIQ